MMRTPQQIYAPVGEIGNLPSCLSKVGIGENDDPTRGIWNKEQADYDNIDPNKNQFKPMNADNMS